MKCEIAWISKENNWCQTSDENEAIGTVYREAYTQQNVKDALNGCIHYEETVKFPICSEHAKRLSEPGMEHWIFEPLTGLEDSRRDTYHEVNQG